MKRISHREFIIQIVVFIGLWLGIVAWGAIQDDAGMIEALGWSLAFKWGYHFAWIFPLCIMVLYNFIVSAGSIIRSKTKDKSNKLVTKTTVQVVLLISLLCGSLMVIQFTSKRRAAATLTEAIEKTNDYRILYPEGLPALELRDDFRITSNQADFLVITRKDGTQLMAVISHASRLIVIQKLSP